MAEAVRRAVGELEKVEKKGRGNQGKLAHKRQQARRPAMEKPAIGGGDGESGQGGEGAMPYGARAVKAREGSRKLRRDARGGKAGQGKRFEMASAVRGQKGGAAFGAPILVQGLVGGDGIPKKLKAGVGRRLIRQRLVVGAGLRSQQRDQSVVGLDVFKRHAKPGAQASRVEPKRKGPKDGSVVTGGFIVARAVDGFKKAHVNQMSQTWVMGGRSVFNGG